MRENIQLDIQDIFRQVKENKLKKLQDSILKTIYDSLKKINNYIYFKITEIAIQNYRL